MNWPLGRCGYTLRRTPRPLIEERSAALTPTIDMLINHLNAMSAISSFATIGAFDGVQGDPLWPYVAAGRWRGVAVEPQRAVYERLCANLADVPGVVAINAAVGPVSGRATLFKAAGDPADGTDLDWRYQQASLVPEQVGRLRDSLPDLPRTFFEEDVAVITFDEVMRRAGLVTIDVIQIDTEGYDWEVLRGIDLGRVGAKLVVFEHRHLCWSDREAAISHLIAHGFKVGAVTAHDTAAVAGDLL